MVKYNDRMLKSVMKTLCIVNICNIPMSQRGKFMNMWVFRITKGFKGGEPKGRDFPIDWKTVEDEINGSKLTRIDYNGDVNWINEELYHGRLRQGWGVPGLDLRRSDQEWVENFLIACGKYWGEEIGDSDSTDAMGRKNILNHMLNMNIGDIVFVPKTPNDKTFIVATVNKKYYFDNTPYPATDFHTAFRHIIEVENLKIYPNTALQAGIFGAPFMHAIDPISPNYQVYGIFKRFVNSQYLID